jgi:hypothetical protein
MRRQSAALLIGDQLGGTAPGTPHEPAPARPALAPAMPHTYNPHPRHCPAPQLVAQHSPLDLAATLQDASKIRRSLHEVGLCSSGRRGLGYYV